MYWYRRCSRNTYLGLGVCVCVCVCVCVHVRLISLWAMNPCDESTSLYSDISPILQEAGHFDIFDTHGTFLGRSYAVSLITRVSR